MMKRMEKLRDKRDYDTRHIDVLDGLRALAILGIAWYHIWQQSWLSATITLPFATVSLDVIPRTGYLLVDLMLLLSAFCLFLPYARAMVQGGTVPSTRLFYQKRIARIVPPYLLCVLLLFGYAVAGGQYGSFGAALRDLLATLTFTQTFSAATYLGTHINGVLWTAAIEMQFYLLFPLLAAAFRKKPLWTYLGMVAVAALYLRGIALPNPGLLRLTLNQLPAFFGVFANGMLAAYTYVTVAYRIRGRGVRVLPWTATAAFLLGLLLLNRLQHGAAAAPEVQVWQGQYRFLLSLVFAWIVLSASLAGHVLRPVLGNPLMRFFAAVSYNLYIWHQWLAVRLKDWRIPYWEGEQLPNMAGNIPWQKGYTALAFLLAIALAALLTYAFERPATRLLMKKTWFPGRESKEEDNNEI